MLLCHEGLGWMKMFWSDNKQYGESNMLFDFYGNPIFTKALKFMCMANTGTHMPLNLDYAHVIMCW